MRLLMVLTFSSGSESSCSSFITLNATSVSACQRQLIKEESSSANSVHEHVHAGWMHAEIPDGPEQLPLPGQKQRGDYWTLNLHGREKEILIITVDLHPHPHPPPPFIVFSWKLVSLPAPSCQAVPHHSRKSLISHHLVPPMSCVGSVCHQPSPRVGQTLLFQRCSIEF